MRGDDLSLELPLNLLNKNHVNPLYEGPQVSVLQETDDFLCVEKPANVHSHPHAYSDRLNVLSAVRALGRGEVLTPFVGECADAGLLYRLDFETSGCLVLAKTPKLKESVFSHREEVMKSKEYCCWVSGRPPCEKGDLISYLLPSEKKGKKMKVFDAPEKGAQRAELSYEVVAYREEDDLSELKVFLKTGLRHQIRAQLAGIQCPLVGDNLYGGKEASRLYLHATSYVFHWQGGDLYFFSEVPWANSPFS